MNAWILNVHITKMNKQLSTLSNFPIKGSMEKVQTAAGSSTITAPFYLWSWMWILLDHNRILTDAWCYSSPALLISLGASVTVDSGDALLAWTLACRLVACFAEGSHRMAFASWNDTRQHLLITQTRKKSLILCNNWTKNSTLHQYHILQSTVKTDNSSSLW